MGTIGGTKPSGVKWCSMKMVQIDVCQSQQEVQQEAAYSKVLKVTTFSVYLYNRWCQEQTALIICFLKILMLVHP